MVKKKIGSLPYKCPMFWRGCSRLNISGSAVRNVVCISPDSRVLSCVFAFVERKK